MTFDLRQILLISLRNARDSSVESGSVYSVTYSASALHNFVEEISDGNLHCLLTSWLPPSSSSSTFGRLFLLFAPSACLYCSSTFLWTFSKCLLKLKVVLRAQDKVLFPTYNLQWALIFLSPTSTMTKYNVYTSKYIMFMLPSIKCSSGL